MQVSDEAKPEDQGGHRGHVGIGPGMSLRQGHCAEPTQKNSRRQGFADPAQGQRTERNAKLHGWQKVVEVALQTADGAGSGNARGKHLLDARIADADQSELSSHKKGVGQDEHGHGDELQQRETVHLALENSIDQGSGVSDQGAVAAPALWNRSAVGCV